MKKISLSALAAFALCLLFLTPQQTFCDGSPVIQKMKDRLNKQIKLRYEKITNRRSTQSRATLGPLGQIPEEQQLPITIFIYAQNASKFVARNLDSVFKQRYQNYRIIYVDDASTDDTPQILNEYLEKLAQPDTLELITYQQPHGKLQAMYSILNDCADEEIIVLIDAHDWLANEWVLSNLCKEYSENDIWITYGSCTSDPAGCNIGLRNGTVPPEIIEKRHFRKIFPFMPLRTFNAWLFKQINKEDLIDPVRGNFYQEAADCYVMWPLMEMAHTHYKAFNEITYVVNCSDPIAKLTEDYHLRMACNSQMGKNIPIYSAITKPIH